MNTVAHGLLRRFSRRIAPAALGLQCLSVLALPVAFCCCIAMAADHAAHAAALDGATAAEEACAHHGGAPRHEGADNEPEGCQHLDQLVMLLAALTGVIDAPADSAPPLVAAGAVFAPPLDATGFIRPVESPPPQA